MYRAWHGVIKRQLPSAKLLMMDTDSLIFLAPSQELRDDEEQGIRFGGKELGDLKDEHPPPKTIEGFCGLAAKVCSLHISGGKDCNTHKGVKRNYVKRRLTFERYRQALQEPDPENRVEFSGMSLKRHVVRIARFTKKCLTDLNDKVYLYQENGEYNTRPLGHHLNR